MQLDPQNTNSYMRNITHLERKKSRNMCQNAFLSTRDKNAQSKKRGTENRCMISQKEDTTVREKVHCSRSFKIQFKNNLNLNINVKKEVF